MPDRSIWEKRFIRERNARHEAERILEEKARDLYQVNETLEAERSSLEDIMKERTAQLVTTNRELRREIERRTETEKNLIAARDEALRLNQQKESFLARVSHDIRTPLNSMVVYARMLNQEQDFDPKKLEAIETGGDMLLSIVNDLLDISKVDAGKMDLAHEVCDLHGLVDSVLEMVQPEADAKGLELASQFSRKLPGSVALDRGRLLQILTNLVSNAVKYTDRGSVVIKATLDQEPPKNPPASFEHNADICTLSISVSDTGQGIPKDRLATLFDPFVRVEESSSPITGTGLGLAIARRLSVLMGGDLKVTSTEGQGSEFTTTIACQITSDGASLQRRDTITTQDVAHLKNMGISKPLRILTVDDNELNRSVLKTMLEYLGYSTDLVSDGLDAISAVQTQHYDVLLLDIRMPHIDGLEVTRRLRAAKIDQPHIVAVTADAIVNSKERYTAAGMDDYLSKPIDMTALAATLDHAFQLKRPDTQPQDMPWASSAVETLSQADFAELIDTSEIRQRLGPLSDNILQRVTPIFLRELPARLENITQSAQKNRLADLANVLHTLKGSSFSVGALKLGELCRALQDKADEGDLPSNEEISNLVSTAQQTAVFLHQRD